MINEQIEQNEQKFDIRVLIEQAGGVDKFNRAFRENPGNVATLSGWIFEYIYIEEVLKVPGVLKAKKRPDSSTKKKDPTRCDVDVTLGYRDNSQVLYETVDITTQCKSASIYKRPLNDDGTPSEPTIGLTPGFSGVVPLQGGEHTYTMPDGTRFETCQLPKTSYDTLAVSLYAKTGKFDFVNALSEDVPCVSRGSVPKEYRKDFFAKEFRLWEHTPGFSSDLASIIYKAAEKKRKHVSKTQIQS